MPDPMIFLGAALLSASVASSPRIELYTMGRGEHLFERFGHTAICVEEAAAKEPRCYNYGTTDFESPPHELGWAFLKGTARFWVSVSRRSQMLAAYRRSDRTIWRQVIPLPPERARQVAERLASEARRENRYYDYHHFTDNCATRVRDVLDEATGGALSSGAGVWAGGTYRHAARGGLVGEGPLAVASELLVGRRADRPITDYEAMFLPEVLRDGIRARLGAEPEVVYSRGGPPLEWTEWPRRFAITGLCLAVAAPLLLARVRRRGMRLARIATAVLLGALGAIVWTVALVARVPELRLNEAVLVFWPGDLLLAVLGADRLRTYARLRGAGLASVTLLLLAGVMRQPLLPYVLVPALPCLVLGGWRRSGRADADVNPCSAG